MFRHYFNILQDLYKKPQSQRPNLPSIETKPIGEFQGGYLPNLNQRFMVNKKLGSGAFGEVYDVTDRMTKKHYALKLLLPEYSKDTSVTAAEYKILELVTNGLAPCAHPNVVCYYDHFYTNYNGLRFGVLMELIKGQSLGSILERVNNSNQPLPFGDLLNMTIDIFSGLQYVHSLGVAHRDIKPDNLMYKSNIGETKLIDFGVSCVKDDLESPGLETCYSIAGTPYYFSPEVSDPRTAVDLETFKAADIWAAGLSIFGLMLGELPMDYLEVEEYEDIIFNNPELLQEEIVSLAQEKYKDDEQMLQLIDILEGTLLPQEERLNANEILGLLNAL